MQVQKLLKLLAQPATLTSEDLPVLETLIQDYPYFYLAHALLAKAVYLQESDVHKYPVQRAATYATDRVHLRAWLEDKLTWPQPTQTTGKRVTHEPAIVLNGYLENIAKKAIKKSTNELSMQQFMVIDNLLNKSNLQLDNIEENARKEVPTIDLAERCTILDDRFATETLANIMIQQKKYKRAIEIYTYLIAKYPEKKAYYDDIVTALHSK